MATILDSTAAFDARALEHGLTEDQLGRLKLKGLNNLSKLAFAISTPGTSPDDESLKTLVHDDPDMVTVGQLASIRRLMFDAQTLPAKLNWYQQNEPRESKSSVPGLQAWNSLVHWNVLTNHTIVLPR